MEKVKEIIFNNWEGYGIFPEWWELPVYHKLWLAPVLFIQALSALPAFMIREHREEKKRYFDNKRE